MLRQLLLNEKTLPYWSRFQRWWNELALREKRGILIAAPLLSIFLLYEGIWSPFLDHIDTLRKRVVSQQKTLLWMQAADKVLRQSTVPAQLKAIPLVVLLSDVQKQMTQAGFATQLIQLKQTGSDNITLQLQKVDFDKLLDVLIQAGKTDHVIIAQLSAVPDATPGIVNADIILKTNTYGE